MATVVLVVVADDAAAVLVVGATTAKTAATDHSVFESVGRTIGPVQDATGG